MEAAPKNALFIWCNKHTEYPKQLARKLGREDLRIFSPGFLAEGRWRGMTFTGIVTDHAFIPSHEQYGALKIMQTCVIPPKGD